MFGQINTVQMKITHFTWYSIAQKFGVNMIKKQRLMNNNSISQYYCFYCMFNQINAALLSIKYFFQKHLQILPILNFFCEFKMLLTLSFNAVSNLVLVALRSF